MFAVGSFISVVDLLQEESTTSARALKEKWNIWNYNTLCLIEGSTY